MTRLRKCKAEPIFVEGVPWFRYRITFRLADGRRRSWVRWSVGRPWIFEELTRELVARGIEPHHIKERSCTIRHEPPRAQEAA